MALRTAMKATRTMGPTSRDLCIAAILLALARASLSSFLLALASFFFSLRRSASAFLIRL